MTSLITTVLISGKIIILLSSTLVICLLVVFVYFFIQRVSTQYCQCRKELGDSLRKTPSYFLGLSFKPNTVSIEEIRQRSKVNGQWFLSRGFTLIELLVVVAIIGLLATVAVVSFKGAIERGKVAKAVGDSKALKTATEMYFNRMGFYPPDVGRGCDPGYLRPLPWSPDGRSNCGYNCTSPPPYLPSNWCDQVEARWDGPYLEGWRRFGTPWGGLYDYNYWASDTSRDCPGGTLVDAGVYIGVQGYYDNSNQMTSIAERIMLEEGIDGDGCENGEAQLTLFKL